MTANGSGVERRRQGSGAAGAAEHVAATASGGNPVTIMLFALIWTRQVAVVQQAGRSGRPRATGAQRSSQLAYLILHSCKAIQAACKLLLCVLLQPTAQRGSAALPHGLKRFWVTVQVIKWCWGWQLPVGHPAQSPHANSRIQTPSCLCLAHSFFKHKLSTEQDCSNSHDTLQAPAHSSSAP